MYSKSDRRRRACGWLIRLRNGELAMLCGKTAAVVAEEAGLTSAVTCRLESMRRKQLLLEARRGRKNEERSCCSRRAWYALSWLTSVGLLKEKTKCWLVQDWMVEML